MRFKQTIYAAIACLGVAACSGPQVREALPLPPPPVVQPAQPRAEGTEAPKEPEGPTLADLLYDVRAPIQRRSDYTAAHAALAKIPAQRTVSSYLLDAFILFGKGEYESAGDKVLGIEQLILSNPAYLDQLHAELGPHKDLGDLFASPQYQGLLTDVHEYANKWWTPRSLWFVLTTCYLFNREPEKVAPIYKAKASAERRGQYRAMLTTLRDNAAQRQDETLRAKYAEALELLGN